MDRPRHRPRTHHGHPIPGLGLAHTTHTTHRIPAWRLTQIDWSAPSPAERAHENDQIRLAEQASRRREAQERDSHSLTPRHPQQSCNDHARNSHEHIRKHGTTRPRPRPGHTTRPTGQETKPLGSFKASADDTIATAVR
ncbi:hypothetical protein FFI94_016035 [Rhodococcus sp. KBS0724]|nr:hypothetical protein FFI94_016035 [Rhodococcus sp. KBS0724]